MGCCCSAPRSRSTPECRLANGSAAAPTRTQWSSPSSTSELSIEGARLPPCRAERGMARQASDGAMGRQSPRSGQPGRCPRVIADMKSHWHECQRMAQASRGRFGGGSQLASLLPNDRRADRTSRLRQQGASILGELPAKCRCRKPASWCEGEVSRASFADRYAAPKCRQQELP